MIKRFLSMYRPRYIRSLVYMLQASEYNTREFFVWFRRVRDFSSVEKRKRLVKTPKALALLSAAWVSVCVLMLAGAYAYTRIPSSGQLLFLVLFLALVPFFIPLFLIAATSAGALFQNVVERSFIARAHKKLSKSRALKIAIAGSFGKTSMREILKTTLSEGKIVVAPPASHNTPLGICTFIFSLSGDEEILIFELGEYYRGDVRRLCEIVEPDLGIITGVNEAHLEKFGTLDNTADTIFELSECLKERPLYINGESEMARSRAQSMHIVYTRDGVGEWRIQDPHTDLKGTTFRLIGKQTDLRITSKLIGLHHLGPLAAAAHIASTLGFSPEKIQRGLSNTAAFQHRMEQKDWSGAVLIDDSYNGNPDGARAAIEFLRGLFGVRRFYVTPGFVETGSRKEAVHKNLGRQLADAGIEKVVLIENSVTALIENGLEEGHFNGDVLRFNDMPQALAALSHSTVQGDVVLIQNDWPDQYE